MPYAVENYADLLIIYLLMEVQPFKSQLLSLMTIVHTTYVMMICLFVCFHA